MGWRDWTGVGERRWKTAPNEEVQPGKTLWDWLQLLIVPAILIGVTFAWSATQDSRDKSRADQARQDTTLNDYNQQMSDLMLDKSLLSSKPDEAVRSVARTVTLTTLRRLDGSRKGEVVRFLKEARLIERGILVESGTLVRLGGADLSNADLRRADLTRADLTGADLSRADLSRANLRGADLSRADLTDADLTRADLTDAVLERAVLMRANLTGADLTDAKLTGVYFITDADLTNAVLRGTKGLPKQTP
jgi:uncharacterized protein YjbI with pentapeptide repeats